MNAIQELLKDYPKQTFKNNEEIQAFMNAHPELFKWYFQEKNGSHSANLIQSDLKNTYTTELKFTDMVPGTKIRLVFAQSGAFESTNHKDIIIGATGNYYADNLVPVYGIYLIKDPNNKTDFPVSTSGAVSYQYKTPVRTSFNSITNTKTSVGEYKQFVGEVNNLVESLTTTRDSVTKICTSRYFKRPVEYLFYEGENLNYVEDAYLPSYNSRGYRDLVPEYNGKLLWNFDNYKWENNVLKFMDVFDEEEHLAYSPFSIYVLRNSLLYNNVSIEDLRDHLFKEFAKSGDLPDNEIYHRVDHMFEKYYIDRYLHAQTAEEMLTEYMSICARIKNGEDSEEISAWEAVLEGAPLYVFDPWIGKVYKVGVDYDYNPTIVYNNEPIDLREIQRYVLDNLEPEDSIISVGNGVYGDIFYQNVTTLYGFEENEEEIYVTREEDGTRVNLGSLKTAKDNYEQKFNDLRIKKWPKNYSEEDPVPNSIEISRKDIDDLNELYDNYNYLLKLSIDRWISKEE